jgi:hypothetical protein
MTSVFLWFSGAFISLEGELKSHETNQEWILMKLCALLVVLL